MNDLLTTEQVAKALPKGMVGLATQEFTDKINNIATDPEVAQVVRENFVTYSKVLSEGKFKTEDYLNAITYVTYKMMGLSNGEAYARTFPHRNADHLARGLDPKTISSYVSMFHRGKLVQAIMEQSMIPFWLINQEARQKALNVQVDLMQNAMSEMVRTTAANSVLAHTDKPKDMAPLVSITVQDNGMESLKGAIRELAEAQLAQIHQGVPVKDMAAQKLMGRVIEHDDQD